MLKENRTNATCWTTNVPTTCPYKHRWSTPCSLKLPQGSSMRVRQAIKTKMKKRPRPMHKCFPIMSPMLKENHRIATLWTTHVPTTCSYKNWWATRCSLKLPQGSSMRVRQTIKTNIRKRPRPIHSCFPIMSPMLKENHTNAILWTTHVPTTCSYKHWWATRCCLKLQQNKCV